jgi:peptidyl-prolyl cis-trans isomerase SurA
VQRVGTRQSNVDDENRRAQMREMIGQRKLEDEWTRFLREMRGEAFVDVRTGAGATQPAQGATPAATPPSGS